MIAKTAAKTNPSTAAKAEGQAFTISRVIDAPLDRVWKAWTDAMQLKHWWGPKGFEIVSTKVDLRPGGVFHYHLRSPDGQDIGASSSIAKSCRKSVLCLWLAFRMKREA